MDIWPESAHGERRHGKRDIAIPLASTSDIEHTPTIDTNRLYSVDRESHVYYIIFQKTQQPIGGQPFPMAQEPVLAVAALVFSTTSCWPFVLQVSVKGTEDAVTVPSFQGQPVVLARFGLLFANWLTTAPLRNGELYSKAKY